MSWLPQARYKKVPTCFIVIPYIESVYTHMCFSILHLSYRTAVDGWEYLREAEKQQA